MLDKPHVFISGDHKSIADRYRLLSSETGELLNDAVSVSSEMFESSITYVLLNDAATIWSSDKTNQSNHTALIAIKDHVALTSTLVELVDSDMAKLVEDPLLMPNSEQAGYIACMPLILPDGINLGCMCVVKQTDEGLSTQQKMILRILAKDLVSQLELRKKNAQYENLTELYELIIETNQDLIFAKDKEFKIVLANSAFLALYPDEMQDKIIGYTTLESYQENEVAEFLQNDKIAFHKGKSDVIEKISFPNGEVRSINTVKTRFHDNSGEPYILGVSRDVTERETLIEKLEKSNDDLDEFAYVASHDLKSPLNAIKRLVSFIEEDAVDGFDELTTKHFEMIKGRADRMLKLLSDLLSFARIGRDPQEFELLNLQSVSESCIGLLDVPSGFNIDVKSKNLFLPRIPLELVLTNLMSNAVKHHESDSGKICISSEEKTKHYEIIIEDDGPGISEKMHDKIFQKFQTLKPRDQVEGSGLGLSMVQKTVEYYGGSISVATSDLNGAKFIINWPKKQ